MPLQNPQPHSLHNTTHISQEGPGRQHPSTLKAQRKPSQPHRPLTLPTLHTQKLPQTTNPRLKQHLQIINPQTKALLTNNLKLLQRPHTQQTQANTNQHKRSTQNTLIPRHTTRLHTRPTTLPQQTHNTNLPQQVQHRPQTRLHQTTQTNLTLTTNLHHHQHQHQQPHHQLRTRRPQSHNHSTNNSRPQHSLIRRLTQLQNQ